MEELLLLQWSCVCKHCQRHNGPEVEFISQVLTQILIKFQFQNLDLALTSKSLPNISILKPRSCLVFQRWVTRDSLADAKTALLKALSNVPAARRFTTVARNIRLKIGKGSRKTCGKKVSTTLMRSNSIQKMEHHLWIFPYIKTVPRKYSCPCFFLY